MAGAGLHQSGVRRRTQLAILSASLMGGFAIDCAAQMENPLEILAVRVREQGHACDKPIKAERDQEASQPMGAVWILQCSNASYRITLHPDMAAKIDIMR